MLDRARWLGSPWFFVSVALLALNDHLFKSLWPGFVTGKLSDVAGLVVVGTVISVLLGRSWGTALAGVGFAVLKTVPGVAELVAPLLGGGVTLRDGSDLIALLVLPPLWFVLSSVDATTAARNRRGWQAVGLIAAVLATTATSPAPPSGARHVGYLDGAFYAEVHLDQWGTRWVRSEDGGATWSRAEDPGELPTSTEWDPGWQLCADDGVCFRDTSTHTEESETVYVVEHVIERMSPGAQWIQEATLSWTQDGHSIFVGGTSVAVNPSHSDQIVLIDEARTFYRAAPGDWREVDLIEPARDPAVYRAWIEVLGDPRASLVSCLLLSGLCWLVVPWRSAKIAIQVLVAGAAFVLPGWSVIAGCLKAAYLNVSWTVLATATMLSMGLVGWLRRRRARFEVLGPGPDWR